MASSGHVALPLPPHVETLLEAASSDGLAFQAAVDACSKVSLEHLPSALPRLLSIAAETDDAAVYRALGLLLDRTLKGRPELYFQVPALRDALTQYTAPDQPSAAFARRVILCLDASFRKLFLQAIRRGLADAAAVEHRALVGEAEDIATAADAAAWETLLSTVDAVLRHALGSWAASEAYRSAGLQLAETVCLCFSPSADPSAAGLRSGDAHVTLANSASLTHLQQAVVTPRSHPFMSADALAGISQAVFRQLAALLTDNPTLRHLTGAQHPVEAAVESGGEGSALPSTSLAPAPAAPFVPAAYAEVITRLGTVGYCRPDLFCDAAVLAVCDFAMFPPLHVAEEADGQAGSASGSGVPSADSSSGVFLVSSSLRPVVRSVLVRLASCVAGQVPETMWCINECLGTYGYPTLPCSQPFPLHTVSATETPYLCHRLGRVGSDDADGSHAGRSSSFTSAFALALLREGEVAGQAHAAAAGASAGRLVAPLDVPALAELVLSNLRHGNSHMVKSSPAGTAHGGAAAASSGSGGLEQLLACLRSAGEQLVEEERVYRTQAQALRATGAAVAVAADASAAEPREQHPASAPAVPAALSVDNHPLATAWKLPGGLPGGGSGASPDELLIVDAASIALQQALQSARVPESLLMCSSATASRRLALRVKNAGASGAMACPAAAHSALVALAALRPEVRPIVGSAAGSIAAPGPVDASHSLKVSTDVAAVGQKRSRPQSGAADGGGMGVAEAASAAGSDALEADAPPIKRPRGIEEAASAGSAAGPTLASFKLLSTSSLLDQVEATVQAAVAAAHPTAPPAASAASSSSPAAVAWEAWISRVNVEAVGGLLQRLLHLAAAAGDREAGSSGDQQHAFCALLRRALGVWTSASLLHAVYAALQPPAPSAQGGIASGAGAAAAAVAGICNFITQLPSAGSQPSHPAIDGIDRDLAASPALPATILDALLRLTTAGDRSAARARTIARSVHQLATAQRLQLRLSALPPAERWLEQHSPEGAAVSVLRDLALRGGGGASSGMRRAALDSLLAVGAGGSAATPCTRMAAGLASLVLRRRFLHPAAAPLVPAAVGVVAAAASEVSLTPDAAHVLVTSTQLLLCGLAPAFTALSQAFAWTSAAAADAAASGGSAAAAQASGDADKAPATADSRPEGARHPPADTAAGETAASAPAPAPPSVTAAAAAAAATAAASHPALEAASAAQEVATGASAETDTEAPAAAAAAEAAANRAWALEADLAASVLQTANPLLQPQLSPPTDSAAGATGSSSCGGDAFIPVSCNGLGWASGSGAAATADLPQAQLLPEVLDSTARALQAGLFPGTAPIAPLPQAEGEGGESPADGADGGEGVAVEPTPGQAPQPAAAGVAVAVGAGADAAVVGGESSGGSGNGEVGEEGEEEEAVDVEAATARCAAHAALFAGTALSLESTRPAAARLLAAAYGALLVRLVAPFTAAAGGAAPGVSTGPGSDSALAPAHVDAANLGVDLCDAAACEDSRALPLAAATAGQPAALPLVKSTLTQLGRILAEQVAAAPPAVTRVVAGAAGSGALSPLQAGAWVLAQTVLGHESSDAASDGAASAAAPATSSAMLQQLAEALQLGPVAATAGGQTSEPTDASRASAPSAMQLGADSPVASPAAVALPALQECLHAAAAAASFAAAAAEARPQGSDAAALSSRAATRVMAAAAATAPVGLCTAAEVPALLAAGAAKHALLPGLFALVAAMSTAAHVATGQWLGAGAPPSAPPFLVCRGVPAHLCLWAAVAHCLPEAQLKALCAQVLAAGNPGPGLRYILGRAATVLQHEPTPVPAAGKPGAGAGAAAPPPPVPVSLGMFAVPLDRLLASLLLGGDVVMRREAPFPLTPPQRARLLQDVTAAIFVAPGRALFPQAVVERGLRIVVDHTLASAGATAGCPTPILLMRGLLLAAQHHPDLRGTVVGTLARYLRTLRARAWEAAADITGSYAQSSPSSQGAAPSAVASAVAVPVWDGFCHLFRHLAPFSYPLLPALPPSHLPLLFTNPRVPVPADKAQSWFAAWEGRTTPEGRVVGPALAAAVAAATAAAAAAAGASSTNAPSAAPKAGTIGVPVKTAPPPAAGKAVPPR